MRSCVRGALVTQHTPALIATRSADRTLYAHRRHGAVPLARGRTGMAEYAAAGRLAARLQTLTAGGVLLAIANAALLIAAGTDVDAAAPDLLDGFTCDGLPAAGGWKDYKFAA